MRRLILLLPLCLALASLSACGNKGPLVRATSTPATSPRASAPTPPASAASVQDEPADDQDLH